jgi:hypothetical protein
MGAVESGELHDGQPVSLVPRLPPASPPELGLTESKSRTDGEMRVIRRSTRLTRCNALPNVDTGRESEIIPYLLVRVILFGSRSGGTQ